jgi:hypothetical protein
MNIERASEPELGNPEAHDSQFIQVESSESVENERLSTERVERTEQKPERGDETIIESGDRGSRSHTSTKLKEPDHRLGERDCFFDSRYPAIHCNCSHIPSVQRT